MDDDVLDDVEAQSGETSATRTISNLIKNDKTEPAHVHGEAVYGDTDMNPNAEDQADVHHGNE